MYLQTFCVALTNLLINNSEHILNKSIESLLIDLVIDKMFEDRPSLNGYIG